MNKKQILIIFCLFAVFISAMSFACAADDVGDSAISVADDTAISQATDTQDILTANSGSLTQLDSLIQNTPVNGTIKLVNNYTYSSGDSIDGIVISKDITIDGDGHMVDGANTASIFNITNNAHVTLKNIILSNAIGTNGSAITLTSRENVEIINATFINNSALNGGAIYIAAADTSSITSSSSIANSKFIGNSAENGGAIYVGGTLTSISSSAFINNKATNDGGSMYLDVGAHIDDCVFQHESAGHDGGAIYLDSIVEDVSSIDPVVLSRLGVFNSTMSYCSAGNDGGAGYINANRGTVRNVTFINNTAGHDGGAGYVAGYWGNLIGSAFINNTAGHDGGAVMWVGVNGTIYRITVINNTAIDGDGGGIYLRPPETLSVFDGISIINCSTFVHNVAGGNGGSLYCGGLFSIIRNSTFVCDEAYNGAGIYLDVGAAISNCVFNKETATNDGGAIYLHASNTNIAGVSESMMSFILQYVGVRHSVITNCVAGHDGGAGYVYGNRGVVQNLTMINNTAGHDGGAGYVVGNYGQLFNSVFINNTASNDGGALLWEGVNGTINNITVINNKAANNGGGVALDAASSQGTITLSNSTFVSNDASYGGAIYCANMFSNIVDSSFANDKADYGAGIYLDYGAYIHNATMFNETAKYDGGGIYLNSSNTDLDPIILQQLLLTNKVGVIDSVILNCSAGRDGGAGYVYGDYGVVNNLTMINNIAGRDGGAGYVLGNYGRLYNSTMINNRAGDDGGALFWKGNGGSVFNITCRVNFADDKGGSIFISGSDLSFTDSIFALTNATNYGGAIYISGDNVLINNSIFDKCGANLYHGGAIYAAGSNTTISKSTFTMNRVNVTAEARGGSIDVQGSDTKIIDSVFDKCTAYEGGVIYVNGTNAVLDNLSCIYSLATNGGAFYINGNNASILNTEVSYNNASNYGGALYIAGDFATIYNSTFTRCIAYLYDGGAIYAKGLNTTISESSFTMNLVNVTNKGRGGSINVQGNGTKILDCIFDRCTAYEGGVIYVFGSDVTIDGYACNRSFAINGGAIYVMGGSVSISNFNISNTNATDYGGAIYVAGDLALINNSNFTRCIAYTQDGGALYVAGLNTTIINSNFKENRVVGSKARGGSMYVQGNDLNLENCTFTKCTAYEGGVIYINGSNARIEESSNTFSMAESGSAIYVAGNNVTICHFESSYANATLKGGSIYIEGNDSNILNSSFLRVHTLLGGAIYISGDRSVVDESTFTYCMAQGPYAGGLGGAGGSIYVEGENATISGSSFLFSQTVNYGGAIYVDGANAVISGTSYENCSASAYNGGAIFVKGLNTTISDSNFTRNRVNVNNSARGGSIDVQGDDAKIFNCNFDYCTAYDGGIIYINGTNAVIDGSTMTHSSAVNNGGAIYVAGSNATISNSTLNFNNATLYGGAIYVAGNNVRLVGDIFDKCSADKLNGGAVFVAGNNATISSSNFTMNRVNVSNFARGGSIDVAGDDAKILNSTFDFCTAYDGGIIYINGNNAVIDGSTMTHSSAVNNGGAIYVAGENATISNSALNFNNATNYGGAIFVDGANAHIDGDVFDKCSADMLNGGAIFVKGLNATISNSNFTMNRVNVANFAHGGSIDVEGDNTTIQGCIFDFCTAYEGGVIYVNGNDAVIDSSLFSHSSAVNNGGAIYVAGSNATVSNSTLNFNNATNYGGAIYVEGANAHIDGDTFDRCSADKFNGGAVYINGFNATVSNSNFTMNRVNLSNFARGGSIYVAGDDAKVFNTTFEKCMAYEGGVLYLEGDNGVIDGSTFVFSSAVNMGGAVYVAGNNATVSNSFLSYNNATQYGGSIYVAGDNSNIDASTFLRCSVNNMNGGAIYVAGSNATISNSNFTMNSANGTNARGGSIDIQGDDTKVINSTFDRCIAFEGGAIYVNGTRAVIDNSSFAHSTANINGGALYIAGDNASISASTLQYNNATDYGGSIYVEGDNAKITGDVFDKCSANNKYGGAIYVAGLNATISDSNFTMNSANGTDARGGSIDIQGNDTHILNCTFVRCSAYEGGAIYVNGTNAVIDGSTVTFSSAHANGGAIYVAGENATISNSRMTFNNATEYGGAIYVAGNDTLINASVFEKCSANNKHGGAIYVDGLNTTISYSNFTMNSANGTEAHGGAIDVHGNDTTIYKCNFERCSAYDGGTLYIYGEGTVIDDMSFAYSSALHDGGTIYVYGNNVTISNTNFSYSNASNCGGAIYVAGDNVNITNDSFSSTIVKGGDGGAIYIEGYNATVEDSYFTVTQSARGRGGAIFIAGNNATVVDSTLVRANSTSGGFMYIEGDNAHILNSSMMYSNSNIVPNATGKGRGGALFIEGNNAVISADFKFNNATGGNGLPGDGGAIYVAGNNTNITDSTFFATNAKNNGSGGAVYVAGNNVFMNNDTFESGYGYQAGAVYVQGDDAVINMSSFISNDCYDDGGAIYVNGNNGKLYNSNFTHNVAGDDGGAIYWSGAYGSIDNITCFDNNAISSTGSSNGGTICLIGSYANLTGSSFEKTSSLISGGAIFITGNNITVSDSSFKDCNVSYDIEETGKTYANGGGALYVLGNNTNILNCTFEDSNGRQGGALYIQGHNATVDMSSFDSNYGYDDGGAVYVAGENGKLYNSTFTSNIAGDDGGAIYWTGNHGQVDNITCFDNHAISSTGSSNGGTMCIIGSDMSLNASSFEQTHALIAGGAIFITGNNVNLTDSSFKDCNVSMDIEDTHKTYANGGGAVYVLGNTTNILNCTFEDSNAREGGAIYIQGHSVTIGNLSSNSTNALHGGSIYVEGEDAKLLDSNLTFSHASLGGAVYVDGDDTLISETYFANNNASSETATDCSGGAIYVRGENTNITGSTFINSTAYGGDGGAVYVGGYKTIIEKSEFEHADAPDGEGGAIFIAGDSATVIDSTFNDTRADYGGAIYIGGFMLGSDAHVLNCTINSTSSDVDGGAIYVAGDNAVVSVDITNSEAIGLGAVEGFGGAIYIGGNRANITESSFYNCSAGLDASGGAIFVEGDYANIEKSSFNYTYADEGFGAGGAIAVEGNRAVVSESNFTDCYAMYGGVLFVEGQHTKIIDSSIEDSYAYLDGGAIYIVSGEETIVSQSTFDNCTSVEGEGGAIFVAGHYTRISDTNFTNCNASSQDGLGGAIYISGEETTIQNATFDECVSVDGGAIYIEGNDAHIYDSDFVGNKLVEYDEDDNYGGAIYVNGERAVISSSTFENHSAKTGGAIYINGKDTTIMDSNFTNGTADYGGAIFIQGINANIDDSIIENCSASHDGGAIYVNGTDAKISADFKNCAASSSETPNIKGNGGAIYVNGTNADIHDATFSNCTALNDGNGGAIYVAGVNTLVETSKFDTTSTSDNGLGGAIYIEGSQASVVDSEFTNSHARDGGAIYIYGVDATVKDSSFENTVAGSTGKWVSGGEGNPDQFVSSVEGDGGAIYIYGVNANIENATITSSSATHKGGAIYVEGDEAIISVTLDDSHAGIVQSTGTIVPSAYAENINIINDNLDSMIIFVNNNVIVSKDNLNTLKSKLNDVKNNKINNIFVNKNFNSDNYNTASSAMDEIYNLLNSYKNMGSDVGISLMSYYNDIRDDLDEINNNQNYNDFNGHLRNDIKNNLTTMVSYIDKVLELNKTLYESKTAAEKIFVNPINYNSVITRLNQLDNKINLISYDISILDQYDSELCDISTNNNRVKLNLVDIQYHINNLHDEGLRGDGGAIYVDGDNTLIHDSTFTNTDVKTAGDGGAINIAGDNATVRDSSFDGSKANDGAAIYVTGNNAEILDSNFTNMNSDVSGGAIYVAGHNTNISGDSFDSCNSKGTGNTDGGGAIYIVGDGTSISESNFTKSDSKKYGGAIYVAGKNTDILTSNFTSNHATTSGGAIYIQSNLGLNTTVDECYFEDNSAGSSAGALHVSGTNTTVNNSAFVKNSGGAQGGAIFINGINATVQYSYLSENSARTHGGAIYWEGGHGGDSIIGCNISNNRVTSYDIALGGGVYWSAGGASTPGGLLKDTIFDGNYAGKHGGGMDWHRSYNSVMENCTFINNFAEKDGGGFYIGDTGGQGKNITLSGCNFTNNTAGNGGGAISIQMSQSHILDSIFDSNIASFGGSILIKDIVTVNNEIINCTFINSSASYGAAVDQQVKGKGGALFLRDNNILVANSTFIDCNATEGGAIFWDGGENYNRENPSKTIGTRYLGNNGVVANSTFIGNNATKGGAICWTSSNGLVNNSTFIGNNATDGGAVYWKGGVEYMDVQWNYPKAFVVHGNDGTLYDSTFIGNTAENGGAVYWTGENGNISKSVFEDNYAENGGAVYWNNITETAYYSTYSKTVSSGDNGILSNSTFFANKANYESGEGGAIYWNTSSSNITDITFLNNTASKGGAVYWVDGDTLDNSTFRFNKAHTGSAIYVDASMDEMDIVDSTFLENRADSYKFDHYTFTDTSEGLNVSVYFRGNDNIINAIYNAGGEVYFTDVTYLGDGGESYTGSERKTPVKTDNIPTDPNTFYQTDYEVYQDVKVQLYDATNNVLLNETLKTDKFGKVSFLAENVHDESELKLKMEHPEDNYYTYLGMSRNGELVYILIETVDIDCLDDEIINITVIPQNKDKNDAPTGNISLWLNGELIASNIELTNKEGERFSTASVNASKLRTGYYEVYVTYTGDTIYFPQDNSSSFKVREINPTIVIDTEDIYVGENEAINITVSPTNKVTGNVSVYIDSVYIGDLPLKNGTIQINNDKFTAGTHYVIGIYNGDDNFKLVRNTSSFTVKKHDPYFVIHAQNIFVNQTEYIWVEVPDNAKGFVHLKVNGEQYYINLTQGQKDILLPAIFEEDTYEVWGNFSGDDYWYSAVNTTKFTVSKYNITVNVTDVVMTYGGSDKINVTLEFADATGNVTIRINNTIRVFENVPTVNGKASVEISGLNAGNYTIEVSYPGDKKYYGNTTKGNLTVNKAPIPVIIVPQNIFFGQEEQVITYVNTTGTIYIKINDTTLDTENIYINRKYATFFQNGLTPGIYTVEAFFSGNQNYQSGYNKTTFEVYKLNRTIELKVHDIIYGDYEDIQAFVNASGNVTFKVNGHEVTVDLKEGKGGEEILRAALSSVNDFKGKSTLNVYNLAVGRYPVEVTYNGNEYYNPVSTSGVFNVIPLNTSLTISPQDIFVWDNESLSVTIKNLQGQVIQDIKGNITIDINGATYREEINNGVARFVISNLTLGHKTVWAFYDGDQNHTGNRSVSSFEVKPRVPVVTVEGKDIFVGQNETFHVEIPANATGYVIMTGNFTKYGIYISEFENGIAEINVSGLASGTYNVHIKYYGGGNDNYTTAENDDTFTVSKLDTPINISVEDIFYKELANITVSVKDDATGFITIRVVNGSGTIRNITLPIVNGKVNWLVEGLAVDNYTVYANYSGNVKYNVNESSKLFKVKKIAPEITIDAVETNSIRNATVVVHITPGTTGNVSIKVNDKNYTGKIENGVARIIIDQLNSGNYTVDAYYSGDRNYTDASATLANAVNVHRYSCYNMNVTAEDTKVDLNTTIIVKLPYDATGKVAIYVNDSFAGNATVENGVAKLNVTKSIYGKYVVNATFMDGKYANKTVTTNYHVFKWDTPMIITVINETSIYVGDVVNVVVSIPDDIKDNLTIEIAGKSYSAKVIDGNATFKVYNLTYGDKTVTTIYDGNYKYLANSTTHNFTVNKRQSTVVVNTTAINVGDVAVINVTVPVNATGFVVISVNGTNYTVNVTQGKGSINVTGLKSGKYNINVTYLGDEQYLPNVNSTTLDVSKVPSNVTVVVNNITVGDVAIINMTVPRDAVGNITVKVNDTVVVVGIVNGTAQAAVPYLKVGNYTVDVTYNGSDKYLTSSNATKLTVGKVSTEIEVIDQGNGTVVVVIPGNATGNVSIVVENKTFNGTVINGTAIINLTNVTPGVHNITVIYSGDGNHTNVTVNATVNIPKLVTPIKVNVTDIYVGDVARVNVTVPFNATGKVRIEINGKEYFADIDAGVARFAIENLTAGVKTAAVYYAGDDNYTANFTTANFTVYKRPSTVVVNTTAINVGDVAVINVTVPVNATGFVVISVNGTNYTVNVTQGKGSINVTGLKSGSYNINVTYLGDEQYLPNVNSTTLDVSKVPSNVTVVVNNITVGDVAIINMTVPKDAVGNMTVKVNDTIVIVGIVNGTAQAVVPYLKVGNYTVDVTYNGSDKYLTSSNATKLTVGKVSTEIEVIDQGNGTVVVVIPGNATGNVTVIVENQTFNGTVINGTAIINLTNVTPGVHNITVIYSGDGNHTNITVNGTVVIPKLITPIKVNVTDIYVGDVARVNVTVPVNATGKVRIEINGKEYFADIDAGVARFAIENLTAGIKTAYVSYVGDDNYTGNHTSGNFTVFKHIPVVTVNTTDIVVGDVVLINVTAPVDVTRPVIVNVNGVDYAVNITNGVGQLTVSGLNSGSYNVTVKYLGDEKYLTGNNNTTVNVNKVPSNVTVSADNITVGEKAVIEIAVPYDATGNVTVTVDDKDYNVTVVGGKGILVVPGLKVGNYTVDVKYLGDRKYESNTNATKFSVNKLETNEIIVVDQGNGTVVVVIGGNATGNVTIVVENQTFNGTVINGTAIINLTNVTPGEHNITVIYSGDGNHTNITVNGTVVIPKLVTPIKVNVTDIYVGDVERINVTVPVNATGKVRIEINGKEYFADIDAGVARFAIENLTAGVKTVAVSYPGDDNYVANFTTGNFTVFANPVTPEIIVVDQGNGTVVVVIGGNATGNVTIEVEGQNFTGPVINGTAIIDLTNVTPGEHNITVIYSGDGNHTNATVNGTVVIPKLDCPINVTVSEVKEGDVAVVMVTVPVNATGNVTVIVDGREYPGVIVNGTAVVYVENLTAGPKSVIVEYPGDDNFVANHTVGNFTVDKVKTTPELTVVDLGNGTVVVVIGGNATGNVTIEVEGHNFTGPVINGTAIIDLTNVTPGEHNITVIYSGDDIHTNSTVNGTVSVPKLTAPITVDVEDIYVGDVARINVTVPYDAEGKVRIEINGKEYFADIKNGVARFEVENLTAGVKTVAVSYPGDDKYVRNFTTANFTVFKHNSTVSGEIESINVGENVIIKVKVPTDSTGQVLVDIDGVSQYYVNVTNGEGFVSVPYIPSGKYNVNLTYIGDDKYLSSSNITLFDVNKVKPFVIPIAHDIIVGELEYIKLIVPTDATGNVTVVIDGEEYVFNLNEGVLSASYNEGEKYIVAVSGGNGELVISGLPVGEYVVSVRYNGDDKYTYAVNTTVFKVTTKNVEIEVIDQGNGTVVVIVPDNATGNVTITVENQTFTAPVINGTAIVNLTNVTPGEHNITVVYSGDETHNPSTANATVDIPKLYAPISVTAHDIYVGDTEVVVVTVPEDATGTVTIEINGKEYSAPVENGKAVFNVDGLAFGNKTVAVKYSGDDKYRDNYTTGQFEVIKRPTNITAEAQDIYVGADEIISAYVLPKDTTGKVLVNIGDVGYYATIIGDGIAGVIIPELPSGEYTAIVTYEGDDKYLPSTTTVKFTVIKNKAPINAAGDKIEEGEHATVVVKVPEDATGTITITVDGKKYTEEVENGRAVFDVPGLIKGDWDVDASYSGDKKYEANDTITDILVYRNDPVDNRTDNHTGAHHAYALSEGIDLSAYPTGNPILVLLLILITIGVSRMRRFEK